MHSARRGPETFAWENPRQPPTTQTNRPKAKGIADRAKQPPVVRTDDPDNSHIAAVQVEPTRGTKRAQVLDALRAANGDWVNAPDLATQEVGGFGGTRRMRELRQMGWDIETRQSPHDPSIWQHRLVTETPAAESASSVTISS